jgi:ppGpp synthetase/RelA/SpoT-type nucleotidyltranferase
MNTAMTEFELSLDEERVIDQLVDHYLKKQQLIRYYLESLQAQVFVATESPPLSDLVHSVKRRLKARGHLKDKLVRKLRESRDSGIQFDITTENLLTRITDLGGYRILHLHTHQMAGIHENLLNLLEDANWEHYEPPFAHIWDEESREYFEKLHIRTEVNPRLYSSVHYLIRPKGKSEPIVEIQVRTLADEIWGETDHQLNYPYPHESVACREQLRVLARVASSCSRLVDSIMTTHDEWLSQQR